MHELAITEDVFKKALTYSKDKNMEKVKSIKIRIGETLLHDLEEVKQIFSMLSSGSILEGAKLELELMPLKAKCVSCGSDFAEKTLRMDCPQCGGTNISITSGKEIEIVEVA
jgi:hydrogenase nickel incorporation protein HypA/HybF